VPRGSIQLHSDLVLEVLRGLSMTERKLFLDFLGPEVTFFERIKEKTLAPKSPLFVYLKECIILTSVAPELVTPSMTKASERAANNLSDTEIVALNDMIYFDSDARRVRFLQGVLDQEALARGREASHIPWWRTLANIATMFF